MSNSGSIVKQYPKFKELVNIVTDSIRPTHDNKGALLDGKILVSEGEEDSGSVVKMHQTVTIVPVAPVEVKKYLAMVSYHPDLADLGSVSCPSLVAPGEQVLLSIRARKSFDLKDLSYVFKVYIID